MPSSNSKVPRKPLIAEGQGVSCFESGESAGEMAIVLTAGESSANAAGVFLPERYTVDFRDGGIEHMNKEKCLKFKFIYRSSHCRTDMPPGDLLLFPDANNLCASHNWMQASAGISVWMDNFMLVRVAERCLFESLLWQLHGSGL
jgi:hypothetical protein